MLAGIWRKSMACQARFTTTYLRTVGPAHQALTSTTPSLPTYRGVNVTMCDRWKRPGAMSMATPTLYMVFVLSICCDAGKWLVSGGGAPTMDKLPRMPSWCGANLLDHLLSLSASWWELSTVTQHAAVSAWRHTPLLHRGASDQRQSSHVPARSCHPGDCHVGTRTNPHP